MAADRTFFFISPLGVSLQLSLLWEWSILEPYIFLKCTLCITLHAPTCKCNHSQCWFVLVRVHCWEMQSNSAAGRAAAHLAASWLAGRFSLSPSWGYQQVSSHHHWISMQHDASAQSNKCKLTRDQLNGHKHLQVGSRAAAVGLRTLWCDHDERA